MTEMAGMALLWDRRPPTLDQFTESQMSVMERDHRWLTLGVPWLLAAQLTSSVPRCPQLRCHTTVSEVTLARLCLADGSI